MQVPSPPKSKSSIWPILSFIVSTISLLFGPNLLQQFTGQPLFYWLFQVLFATPPVSHISPVIILTIIGSRTHIFLGILLGMFSYYSFSETVSGTRAWRLVKGLVISIFCVLIIIIVSSLSSVLYIGTDWITDTDLSSNVVKTIFFIWITMVSGFWFGSADYVKRPEVKARLSRNNIKR